MPTSPSRATRAPVGPLEIIRRRNRPTADPDVEQSAASDAEMFAVRLEAMAASVAAKRAVKLQEALCRRAAAKAARAAAQSESELALSER